LRYKKPVGTANQKSGLPTRKTASIIRATQLAHVPKALPHTGVAIQRNS
jgi:hypothetical protein